MDDKLKEMISTDDFKMSDIMSQKLDTALGRLPERKAFNLRKFVMAASLVLAVLAGSTAFAYANGYKLKDIYRIFNFYDSRKDISQYVAVQNNTVKDKGIALTLNESILDENNLVLNITVKSDKPFEKSSAGNEMKMLSPEGYIGDQLVTGISYGYGEFKDEYTYDMSIDNVITYNNLPDKFDFKYIIKEINGVKGNWVFNLNLNKEDINKDSKIVNLNKIIDFRGGKAAIKKVVFTPVSTRILLEEINGFKKPSVPKNFEESIEDGFIIYNEDGKVIPFIGIVYHNNENGLFNALISCNQVDKYPTSLTLVPYKAALRHKEIIVSSQLDKSKLPIELKHASGSTLIITSIKTDENSTQISFVEDLVSPDVYGNPTLSDEDGKIIEPKSYAMGKRDGLHLEGSVIYPPLSNDKKYTFSFNDSYTYKVLEDQKIVIPIN